jgi:hypothetical protein
MLAMPKIPMCPVHDIGLICPACVGTAGGVQRSEKKAVAARENGKLGGRPRTKRKGGKKIGGI